MCCSFSSSEQALCIGQRFSALAPGWYHLERFNGSLVPPSWILT